MIPETGLRKKVNYLQHFGGKRKCKAIKLSKIPFTDFENTLLSSDWKIPLSENKLEWNQL